MLPLAKGGFWPPRDAERPTANVSNASHTRQRRFGRLLYVAVLPVIAGTWLAPDEPKRWAI